MDAGNQGTLLANAQTKGKAKDHTAETPMRSCIKMTGTVQAVYRSILS